ncbi:MAG: efflux RND transporter permease subunit [Pacificimonas sp.]
MILSTAALRQQPVLFFLVGILMAFGLFSYFNLPAREDPKITIRQAVVTTAYPGLSARQVELLITKPLEEAIYELPHIKDIESTSMNGISILKPEFTSATPDLEVSFDQLAETVTETQPLLPDGARPSAVNDDFGDIAVMTLALAGADYDNAELADYAQHVRDRFITVPGTKKVELLGVRAQRIFVEYNNAELSQLGVPPQAILSSLQQENVIRPGGAIDIGDTSLTVRPSGDFRSLDDIRNTLIRAEDGTVLRLGGFTKVSRGYEDPPQRRAYYNGDETIILAVAMEDGLSVLNYSETARKRVEDIAATLPTGLTLDIVTYEATKVGDAVYGVTFNMLQTLAIVLGIVILFLGVRTGLIVGAIVPAVILASFAIMGLFQIPLQRMSLATIIISLGLLVDNGVVIAEDFKRRVQELGDRDEALEKTSRELAFPLLSSSLTTIAVFLPLLIAATDSTEYTRTISLVIIITLSMSWLFAMTVTTTLCHRFLKVPEKDADETEDDSKVGFVERIFDRLTDAYARALRLILGFRWLYVGGMVLLFALGGMLQGRIPQEFFPSNNNPQVLVYVELPPGVTTRLTDRRVREISELISDEAEFPEIQDFAAYVGFGGPRFVLSLAPVDPAPNKGFFVINTKDLEDAVAIVPRLREAFAADFPDVTARVTRMFLGPEDPAVIKLQVTGPDADYINERAQDVMALLAETDGMIDIWSNWRGRETDIDLVVDQQAARAAGVTSDDISSSLARHLDGQPVTMFREGDEMFPIVMRAEENERTSIDMLQSIAVYGADGSSVPLGQVAKIELSGDWGFRQREDLERAVTIEGRNLFTSPDDLAPQLQPKLDELNETMAPGHEVKIAGILEESGQTNAALASTAPLVFGIIFFLLIAQFGGFKRAFVIVGVLPFVTFGAFLGLLIMQSTFGFMAILSLFALIGIIVNNSIVLVDRIDIERNETLEADAERPDSADETSADRSEELDAVVSACRRRFRPVVMTTLTTVAGLLPLIIAQDVLFYGFASSIAFGLLIGTPLVSLGMTPVLYCLMFGIKRARDGDDDRSTSPVQKAIQWIRGRIPGAGSAGSEA